MRDVTTDDIITCMTDTYIIPKYERRHFPKTEPINILKVMEEFNLDKIIEKVDKEFENGNTVRK